jgi:predicted kinase
MKKTLQKVKEYMLQGPTFLMMVGVPGSGKSTFLSQLQDFMKITVASTDDLIELEAKKMGITYSEAFNKVNFKSLKRQMDEVIVQAVRRREHIALDQTNMSRKSRVSKLEAIPATAYSRICLNFTVDDKVLTERLRVRAETTGKIIPPFVLKNMFDSYQPPSREEGFTQILEVNNDAKL